MNRILIFLIRLLYRDRAETEPDNEQKRRLFKEIMKKSEGQTNEEK